VKRLLLLLVSLCISSMFMINISTAWWNSSYSTRYKCQTSASSNIINYCNGSEGINGHVIVYFNTSETIYAYCTDENCSSGDFALANETDKVCWENRTTRTGNCPETVWNIANSVLSYDMNIQGSTIYDSSGQGNDATNDAATNTTGLYGSALNFDSIGGDRIYATTQNGMTFTGGGPTLNFWIFETTQNTGYEYVTDVRDGSDHMYLYMHNLRPVCGIFTNTGSTECTSDGAVTYNEWAMVTCLHNGTHVNIYINGTLVKSCARSGTPNAWDDNIYIGSRYTDVQYLIADLDEYTVYNVTLTDQQISDMYNSRYNTLGAKETYTPPGLTCTAPASGTWNVSCADNCNWTTAQDVPGNMTIYGSGTLSLSALFTFTGSDQYVTMNTSGCELDIYPGGGFR